MTALLPVFVQCPKCEIIFKTIDVGLLRQTGTDECGCQQFRGVNPMPFFIRICPSCKFIDVTSSFQKTRVNDTKNIPREQKKSCEIFLELARILENENRYKAAVLAYYNAGCCYRVERNTKFKASFQEAVRLLKIIQNCEGDIELQGIKVSLLIERLQNCSKQNFSEQNNK
ncbi:MAG: DUF2225 domain-containing protein [Candidatus Hodarchaeota archaeon]